jgi:hypothetical protein
LLFRFRYQSDGLEDLECCCYCLVHYCPLLDTLIIGETTDTKLSDTLSVRVLSTECDTVTPMDSRHNQNALFVRVLVASVVVHFSPFVKP